MDAEALKALSMDEKAKKAIKTKNPKLLDLLATDACPYTRQFVAMNKNTRKKTLLILTHDESETVRSRAMEALGM